MQSIVLLVDFDHTLYNSRRYLRALFDRMFAPGTMPWRQFMTAFEKYTEGTKERPLCPADFLQTNYPGSFDASELNRFMTEESGSYLYRDTIPFLARIRNLPLECELVTFAERESRMQQIRSAGLCPYFDRLGIFSTDVQAKIDYILATSRKFSKTILLDDHPAILSPAEQSEINCIRLQRRIYKRYIGKEPPLRRTISVRTLKAAYWRIRRILDDAD